MRAHLPTPSGERAPPDSGDSRLARIWRSSGSSRPSASICLSAPNRAERSAGKPALYKWEIMSADRGRLLPIIDELADRLEPEHGSARRRGGDRRRSHALPRRRRHRGAAQPVAQHHVRRGAAGGRSPGLSTRQRRKTGPAVGHNTGWEGRPAQGRPPTPGSVSLNRQRGVCAVRIVLQPSRASGRSCCRSPIGG